MYQNEYTQFCDKLIFIKVPTLYMTDKISNHSYRSDHSLCLFNVDLFFIRRPSIILGPAVKT